MQGAQNQKLESRAQSRTIFNPAQPPSYYFVASLKARCALSEEFEAQPGSIAWHLQSPSPSGHHTPYTAHRITRRLKCSSKAQIYVAFARPKAACSADLAITSLSSGNWSAAASGRARGVPTHT